MNKNIKWHKNISIIKLKEEIEMETGKNIWGIHGQERKHISI